MIGTETIPEEGSVDNEAAPSPFKHVHEELKNLPNKFERDENRCREILSNHIKRARNGQIVVDELIALISAYCAILYHPKKIPHSYGNLLSHLFAQLEIKWRAAGPQELQLDVKMAQCLLLKRILVSSKQEHEQEQERRVFGGNLVVWTGSMREIRFLTDQSRDLVIEWILKEIKRGEVKNAEDWPVLFHNLFQMSGSGSASGSGGKEEQNQIFLVLNSHCLQMENSHSRALLNHFLFLIRQNGTLCQKWLKFTLSPARKRMLTSPMLFVGLLNLTTEIECGDVVLNGIKAILKGKIELFERICRGGLAGEDRWMRAKSQTQTLEDPKVFMERVANCFGSDSYLEDEITAALLLFKSFPFIAKFRDSFLVEIYKNYPFARREILKNIKSTFCNETWTDGFWLKIYELDPLILKEEIRLDTETTGHNKISFTITPTTSSTPSSPLLSTIATNEPKLMTNLIENEDQIICSIKDENLLIQILNELNSFLLPNLLKNITNFNNVKPLSFVSDCLLSSIDLSRDRDWKNWANYEIWLLNEVIRLVDLRSQTNSDWFVKMIELCELIKIPGVIPCSQLKNHLVICVIEFILKYEDRDKLKMISSTLKEYSHENTSNISIYDNNNTTSVIMITMSDEGSKAILDLLLISPLTILSNQAILKFSLENLKTPNESFYQIISTLLQNKCDEKMLILIARVAGTLEHEYLRKEIVELIGVLASKVVSEPVFSKVLLQLLDIHYKNSDKYDQIPESFITNFSSVSEHLMVKAMSVFMLKFTVTNALEEIIKSIIIFYGIVVEDDSEDSTSTGKNTLSSKNGITESMIKSKFTSLHLNERAIQVAFSNVLSHLHALLTDVKFIIKNFEFLIENLDKFDVFMGEKMRRIGECLLLLTRALTIGPSAIKLHEILVGFYQICTQFISILSTEHDSELKEFKKFITLVCLRLNKQIYLLIPLQQDKIQENLKTRMNLKKEKGPVNNPTSNEEGKESTKQHQKRPPVLSGKSVTNLIYEVERFEEIYLKFRSLHVKREEEGWPDKIIRSTARDFKIRLDQMD